VVSTIHSLPMTGLCTPAMLNAHSPKYVYGLAPALFRRPGCNVKVPTFEGVQLGLTLVLFNLDIRLTRRMHSTVKPPRLLMKSISFKKRTSVMSAISG
jgi:hypothetical protein